MKPVKQTTFGDGSDGNECGNCEAAAIASVLELSIDEVPNFAHLGGEGGWARLRAEWLYERGYVPVSVWADTGATAKPIGEAGSFIMDFAKSRDEYALLHGVSRRKLYHSVVGRRGEIVHDPHPSGDGLLSITSITFLVPIQSA